MRENLTFARRFSGQSLSNTGRTEKVNHKTAAFSFNEVIKPKLFIMCLDQGFQ